MKLNGRRGWLDAYDSSEYDELNRQDLRHLSQEAVRQSLIAQVQLARHIAKHADSIVMGAPEYPSGRGRLADELRV